MAGRKQSATYRSDSQLTYLSVQNLCLLALFLVLLKFVINVGIPDFRGPKGVWTLEEQGKEVESDMKFEDAKTHTHSHGPYCPGGGGAGKPCHKSERGWTAPQIRPSTGCALRAPWQHVHGEMRQVREVCNSHVSNSHVSTWDQTFSCKYKYKTRHEIKILSSQNVSEIHSYYIVSLYRMKI